MISSRYVFAKMHKIIRARVRCCIGCQKTKVTRHTVSPLQEIQMPTKCFSTVQTDIAGPLPISQGKSFLVVCICRFTTWVEAIPLEDIQTNFFITALMNYWVSRYGAPTEIISDAVCQFTSATFKDFYFFLGAEHKILSPKNLQNNGLIERAIKTKKKLLTAQLNSLDWMEHLKLVMLGLRTAVKED